MSWLTANPQSEDENVHLKAAYAEKILTQNLAIRHVLYGHTHSHLMRPLMRPPRCPPNVSENRHVMYINTGTWRNQIHKAATFGDEHAEFVPAKQMTYVVFFREDEDPGKLPGTVSFDVWTGSKVKRTNG